MKELVSEMLSCEDKYFNVVEISWDELYGVDGFSDLGRSYGKFWCECLNTYNIRLR